MKNLICTDIELCGDEAYALLLHGDKSTRCEVFLEDDDAYIMYEGARISLDEIQ